MPVNLEVTLVYTFMPVIRLVFSYFNLSLDVFNDAVFAEFNLLVKVNAPTIQLFYFFIRIAFK